jgi:cytochrome P450
MEARLLLATILQRSELSLVPGYKEDLDPTITLRPRHGIPMKGKIRT